MEFVKIGEIVNTFGIKGELKVKSFSDFEELRYQKGSTVYVGENKTPFIVNYYKHHKGFTLVQFKDKENINLVLEYKGQEIFKSKDDIEKLTDGRYYFGDLLNLEIRVNGNRVGKCIEVIEGISSNYLRVLKDDDSISLIPYVKGAIVKEVNLDKQYIEIVEMEGLL